jgi:hypothetical protein
MDCQYIERSDAGAEVGLMLVEVGMEMVAMGSKKAFSTSSILRLFGFSE